jgi:hypothetical protein
MVGTLFVHDKDIFEFERRAGREGGRNFYGHGLWKDEGGSSKDEVLAHTFHPSAFIPHPF